MSKERPRAPKNVGDVLSMLTDAMRLQRQRGLPRMAPAQIQRMERLLHAVQEQEDPGSTTVTARERYVQATGPRTTQNTAQPAAQNTAPSAAQSGAQNAEPTATRTTSQSVSANTSQSVAPARGAGADSAPAVARPVHAAPAPRTSSPPASERQTTVSTERTVADPSSGVPSTPAGGSSTTANVGAAQQPAYEPPADAPWMVDESQPPVRRAPAVVASPAAATSAAVDVETTSPARRGIQVGSLEELRDVIGDCRRCTLCESRQSIVFGEGNPNARLMIIGEAPSMTDDAAGRPFVDAAGELLDGMLRAMTLDRSDVYMTTIVKCRPPNNRAPERDELAACAQFLRPAIETVRPDVLLTLGSEASKLLLGGGFDFAKRRGEWGVWDGVDVMPTWHPAHLLLKPEEKRSAWQDLQKVMARLGIQR